MVASFPGSTHMRDRKLGGVWELGYPPGRWRIVLSFLLSVRHLDLYVVKSTIVREMNVIAMQFEMSELLLLHYNF